MKKLLTIVFLLLASVAVSQADYPAGSQLNIDGSTLGWDDTAKKWRPVAVDANGNLKTDSGGTTQEISVDTSNIESYLKEVDGEDTITITDLVNDIATDTKKIKSNLEIDNKTVTELVNDIGTDTATIKNTVALINGLVGTQISPNVSSIANLLVNIKDQMDAQPQTLYTSRLSITANTATAVSALPVSTTNISRVFVELRAVNPDDEFYIGFDDTVTDSTGRPVKGRILLSMPSTQSLYIYHTNTSAIDIQQTEGWR